MTSEAKRQTAPKRKQEQIIVTPGKLDCKKLIELRNRILDEMVERGFIDDDDGLREDIGDLLEENIDFVLAKP